MQQILETREIAARPVAINKQNNFFIWILFFIWPFISLIVSIKNFRSPWAKNIIWAFVTFFGFTFTISQDNVTSDINRYIAWFHQMHSKDMQFGEFWDLLYVHEDYADVAQPLIALIVSKFTDNHFILIAVFGFIYGYLYSRNIWYVVDKLSTNNNFKLFIMLFIFSLVIPFWNINGFRFWTAAHLFLFGVLPFVFEKKKWGLIVASLSLFVHFSFILPVIILGIYFIVGSRPRVFFYFFIASMFITELNIDVISNAIATYLPDIFSERTENYLDEDLVARVGEGGDGGSRSWYAGFYLTALKWSCSAFLIFMFVYRKKFVDDKLFMRLFSFALFFYACANVVSLLPSGIRFTIVANLIAVAAITYFINMSPNEKNMSKLFRFTFPLLLIFIVVTIRLGFSPMGLVTVIGNPVSAMFVESEIALIDLIK